MSSSQGLLPVLHPYPDGTWGRRGATPFALAGEQLGRGPEQRPVTELVLRYLAAFRPASPRDMQAWSGMTRLREVFEAMPALRRFRSGAGAVLYDLPDAPRPGPDVPAPVRFLPMFDNVHIRLFTPLSAAEKRLVETGLSEIGARPIL